MMNTSCRFSILLLFSSFMLTAAYSSEENPSPAGLRVWTVGGGLSERFGPDVNGTFDELNQNKDAFDRFLLTLAEAPLATKQIVEKSALSPSQVEHLISKLAAVKVIRRDEKGRWATTVPVITDGRMQIIRKDVTPMASAAARYLKKATLELETLYTREKSPLDPPWEDVNHLLIDKFIIDGTFHSGIEALERERGSGNGNQNVTPAFFLEQGKSFSSFGTNWYPFNQGDDQREVYVLHGGVLDRYVIAMNEYRGDKEFAAALFKINPEGGIDALTDREKGMLRSLGWIDEEHLMVPIVQARTLKSLWPTIESMGSQSAEVAFAHFSDLTDSFNDSPYSEFSPESEDYVQVCYHVLFGVLIEQLVDNGVVSPIPKPVPDHFGVYLVFGKLF